MRVGLHMRRTKSKIASKKLMNKYTRNKITIESLFTMLMKEKRNLNCISNDQTHVCICQSLDFLKILQKDANSLFLFSRGNKSKG